MALYLISYDIAEKNHDYSALLFRLESWKAVKILYSEWLISGFATTQQRAREEARSICESLEQAIEKGDRLLVQEISRAASWTACSLLISDARFDAMVVAQARDC